MRMLYFYEGQYCSHRVPFQLMKLDFKEENWKVTEGYALVA